ncbi:MAG: hypothetical protein B6I24_08365 [Bacteroidetes bacterium 4572_128]|nr:MAG: hypothetical protein B6I24_08365 [Bacteroidetes bacterium 4572_128]
MKITNLNILIKIVKCDFSKIIIKIEKKHINEFKIFFIDNSFLNIWFSLKIKKRYSYHWERMKIDNTIFRHDNIHIQNGNI